MRVIVDVVGRVRDYLEACALPGVQRVGTEVPSERFKSRRYVVVQRGGGGGDLFISEPRVRVSCFAESTLESRLLAELVEESLLSMPMNDPYVSHVETNSFYEDRWAGTATRDGSPCYTVLFDVVANR